LGSWEVSQPERQICFAHEKHSNPVRHSRLESRYWRGKTPRSSAWTLAIALARKFQTREEAMSVAKAVGGEKIAEITEGNAVIEFAPL